MPNPWYFKRPFARLPNRSATTGQLAESTGTTRVQVTLVRAQIQYEMSAARAGCQRPMNLFVALAKGPHAGYKYNLSSAFSFFCKSYILCTCYQYDGSALSNDPAAPTEVLSASIITRST